MAIADSVFTARRLRMYPVAILAGAVMGFAIFLAASNGLRAPGGGRVGGDFPAFYSAGRIMLAGEWTSLYDFARLREAQAGLFPDQPDGWLTFPYPPFVAIAYAPLSLLPFKTAYVVHVVIMAACCIAALALLAQVSPRVRRWMLPCAAATLTFYPIFRAVVGGQNVAFSLLCASGVATAIARRRDVTAGLWIGVWMFKPQLAIPIAVVVAIGGHPKTLAGTAIGAGALYASTAAFTSLRWPLVWVRDGILPYIAPALAVDRGNGASFREVASELGVPALGWIATLVTIAITLRALRRSGIGAMALVGIAVCCAVLVAPHALFYESGLAVIALAAIADRDGRASVPLLAAMWMAAAAEPARAYLPFPPSTAVMVASLMLVLRAVERDQAGRSSVPFTISSSSFSSSALNPHWFGSKKPHSSRIGR